MGNKSEKRLARKALENEKFEAKKLRQAENPENNKYVSEYELARAEKRVREPEKPRDRNMAWSDAQTDFLGEWSWGSRECLIDDWADEIHPFLTEYEKKTWLQIYDERTGVKNRRQKHISYEVQQICKEAQDRLVELERDDVDYVFRFRLAGPKRLYGVLQAHLFFVLWWDPQHNIYKLEDD